MVWPERLLGSPPEVVVAHGYECRPYRPGDEEEWFRVMTAAFGQEWNQDRLAPWLERMLPNGWFFILHRESGALAATAMACHRPAPLHPFGGELGWVAGDATHGGKGLGRAVCAAVTARFLAAGYRRIYLKTDDDRLAAIKTYLRLGYLPFLFTGGMDERWAEVCSRLEWPFEPERWVRPAA
jgi:mycothiol synthase